jgi:glycosyltransferase involved in cell wall biosynthesis
MSFGKKILLFAPSSHGGLAEYTFYQARALRQAGADVVCLVAPDFLDGRKADFARDICLPSPNVEETGLTKKLKMIWNIMAGRLILAGKVTEYRPDLVLLDSYVEYFSPLWVWPLWVLARVRGIRFAANLHDPVRSYVVGPKWWHKLSVRLAYWPLEFVAVHEKLSEPSPVPPGIRVVQVPHGLFEISGVAQDREKLRSEWGVQVGQKIFLAFGYVRDGKNLDLAIRALKEVPEALLVVAGSVASANDKSFSFYCELAASLGVANRCRFFEGFIADADLGKYFTAADFVLLTYSASFHSQSGVLNIAARARKPVLASASPGALVESVKQFQLGAVVAPDSEKAVVAGMRQLIDTAPVPRWDDYERAASWPANAEAILREIER